MARLVTWLFALMVSQATPAPTTSWQVLFANHAVPGATVTAIQGQTTRVTVTDEHGMFGFTGLADGMWTIRVELSGFEPETREITVGPDAQPSTWTLKLLSYDEITRQFHPQVAQSPGPASPANATTSANGASATTVSVASPASPGNATAASADAADGLLVNGSVENGAATPFAQSPAFGNNRRFNVQPLFTGGLSLVGNTSVWDASPYSFSSTPPPKPSYDDLHIGGTLGGTIKIPGLFTNGPQFVVIVSHAADHTVSDQSAVVPTLAERAGDFAQVATVEGEPITILDPETGLPFPGNVIPAGRISPQAAALLKYWPLPNITTGGAENFQSSVPMTTVQDSVQTRLTQRVNRDNSIAGTLSYSGQTARTTSLLGFTDSTRTSAVDGQASWTHRFSLKQSARFSYRAERTTSLVTPFFAFTTNVSGNAGILGNNQSPENWGPPTLTFADLTSLSDAVYQNTANLTQAGAAQFTWIHGRQTVTYGGDLTRNDADVLSQQNPRGTLSFTGEATGLDFADFLLGLPSTSAISSGDVNPRLTAPSYDTYVNDDWRVRSGLTITAGLRWEYDAPFTEAGGHLVNLDLAQDFTAVAPVLASDPVGAVTGQTYPTSLIRPDKTGVQPRVALSWRPVPTSSLVVKTSYGLYRNTGGYQSLALLMAEQPPLTEAYSLQNTALTPLSLAAFVPTPATTTNTFAVDPNFRVGQVQNWQLSVQRDLVASWTVLATYMGTAGSHLIQASLPNTYPPGAQNPCPTCPSGFVYLTSGGTSLANSFQVLLRRRLHNGLILMPATNRTARPGRTTLASRTAQSTRTALLAFLIGAPLLAQPGQQPRTSPPGTGQQTPPPSGQAQAGQQAPPPATFKATTVLMVQPVTVTDKNGKPIEGLTTKDFALTEDGEPQTISFVEFERLDDTPLPADAGQLDLLVPAPGQPDASAVPPMTNAPMPATGDEKQYRGRRLLVLYFDLTSMPQADQLRAYANAWKYLDTGMRASDLVAILTFSDGAVRVRQPFTADRSALRKVLDTLIERDENADAFLVDDDTASAFGQDDSEFNIFNTDRQLAALQTAVTMLRSLPEEKSLVYFASGLSLNGLDNQAQLLATTNAAIRSNVKLFPVDARGLVAQPPLGDATRPSPGGLGMFNGQLAQTAMAHFQQSQDTLYSLAKDTGGKALLDYNDLLRGITDAEQAQKSYYLLGYYSTHLTPDGKFRRVNVTLTNTTLAANLDYRQGYFADKVFAKFTKADKERQLEDALMLADPVTDIRIRMELNWFEISRAEYFVPIAVKIPGSELTQAKKHGATTHTVIDVIGEIKDEYGVTYKNMRDILDIPLNGAEAATVAKSPIQYLTGMTVLPGNYVIKLLVRDAESGRIGTFQQSFSVPNLMKDTGQVPISSVVLSSQQVPVTDALFTVHQKLDTEAVDPLVTGGQKLIPSVTKVFSKSRDLYVFLQAYERDIVPMRPLVAFVTLYRGQTKALETTPLAVTGGQDEKTKAVPMRFTVPLTQLAPGEYTCQVTVLDPNGQRAAFWQAPIVIVP